MHVHAMSYPFNYVVLYDFFSKEAYTNLHYFVEHYKHAGTKIGQVGHDPKNFYEGKNYSPSFRDLQTTKCSFLLSRGLRDFATSFFHTRVNDYIALGVHSHAAGSPTGWAHSDFNIVSFQKGIVPPTSNSLRMWEPGSCVYTDNSAHNQPNTIKTARHIVCILYVGNEQWNMGDGGETGIFSEYETDRPLISRVPPLNNSLLIFEINPVSAHSFLETKKERNSIIWWYHTSPAYAVHRNRNLIEFKKQYMKQAAFESWIPADVETWDIKNDPQYEHFWGGGMS